MALWTDSSGALVPFPLPQSRSCPQELRMRLCVNLLDFSEDAASEPEKRDPGDHASDRCHGGDHQRS
jgi:hypothetical protein